MTADLIEAQCVSCKRWIVIENYRFTQHTDPRTWDPVARTFRQCAGVSKLAHTGTRRIGALQQKEGKDG